MREVRKAVLLVAGRGTRLGELTRETPKPLLDVAGKPILERIIEGISSAGIREFGIVTGHLSHQIGDFCIKISREHPDLTLETVQQTKLDGTASALKLARSVVSGEEAFLLGWGDVLVEAGVYRDFVERVRAIDCDLLLAVNRVEDPFAGAAVYIDQEDRVTRIIEKPPKGSSTTNWNNA